MEKIDKKFKLWDRKRNKFFNSNYAYINPDGKIYYIEQTDPAEDGVGYFQKEADDLEMMQYTGWTDKTGEEIYEDDIILGHVDGEARIVKDFRRLHFLIMDMQIKESDLEVVGNIHETSKMKEILDNKPKTDYEDYLI